MSDDNTRNFEYDKAPGAVHEEIIVEGDDTIYRVKDNGGRVLIREYPGRESESFQNGSRPFGSLSPGSPKELRRLADAMEQLGL